MAHTRFTFTLAAGLALTGCDMLVDGSGQPGTEPAPVAAAPAPKPEKRSALDEAIDAQDGYAYNPIGKRDPFRSFLTSDEPGTGDVPTGPLQRYEVDQYTLVGIVWGIDRPRALVEDPEGIGHVMEVGTYIGKNWGKVTRIGSEEVIVTEEYQNIRGDLIVNDIKLALPVQEG
ncbi:MAG: pilus assembly protein PilP [Alphaproteobacteria bacterium]|nr:pilus assembly protein PilP [Alphaproteobacteria bacterium]